MDVVKADVGSEPLQHLRQAIIRGTVQRSLIGAPFAVAAPINALELVLNVKQPNADSRGKQRDRQLHLQQVYRSDKHRNDGQAAANRQIGRQYAQPRVDLPQRQVKRKPELDDEQVNRAQPKKHERVTVKAITEPP